jgi:hypothetical protein
MGRMKSEGDACLENHRDFFPLFKSLRSREGGRPPSCSLNILALPTQGEQGEPTSIRGESCQETNFQQRSRLSSPVLMV